MHSLYSRIELMKVLRRYKLQHMNQHLALLEILPNVIQRPGSQQITRWCISWQVYCAKHWISMIRCLRYRPAQTICGRHLCLNQWTMDTQHLIMKSLELSCKRLNSFMVDLIMIKTTQKVSRHQYRSHVRMAKFLTLAWSCTLGVMLATLI